MTAARREASVVACPDCRAEVGSPCVWPDRVARKLPCMNRYKAAERYDGADPPVSADPGEFVRDGLTQLDSDVSQRDITEPLHPPETE